MLLTRRARASCSSAPPEARVVVAVVPARRGTTTMMRRVLPRGASAARHWILAPSASATAGALAGGPSSSSPPRLWASAAVVAGAAPTRAARAARAAAARAPSLLAIPLSWQGRARTPLATRAALSTAAAAAAAQEQQASASPAPTASTSPPPNPSPTPPPPPAPPVPPPKPPAAAVDYTTLLACCAELADPRNGYLPAKVEEVVQSDAHTLALRLRTAGPHALSPPSSSGGNGSPLATTTPTVTHRYWLYVSWHPSAARLCASASDPPRGAASEAYAFGEQVGRLLKGLALSRVALPRAWERAAALEFGPRPSEPPTRRLYAEVMGRHSNAVLTDAGSGGASSFFEDEHEDNDGGGAAGGAGGSGSSNKRATKRQRRQQQQQQEDAEFLRRLPGRPDPPSAAAAASSSLSSGQELVLAAGLQVGERQSSLRQLSSGRPFEPPPAALALFEGAAGGLLPELDEPLERWRRNVEGASELLLRAAAQQRQQQNPKQQQKGRPKQQQRTVGGGGPSADDPDAPPPPAPAATANSEWRPSFADCLVRAYVGVSPSLAAEVADAAGLVPADGGGHNDGANPPPGRRRRSPPAPPPPSALGDDDWRRAHAAWRRWVAAVEGAHAVLMDGGSSISGDVAVVPSPPPKWRPHLDPASNRYSVVALSSEEGEEEGRGLATHPPSVHALLDALHGPAQQAGAAHAQLHARLLSSARAALARSEGRAAAFRKQLSAAAGADALRREADLVMANLYRIPVADAAGSSLASSGSSSSSSTRSEEEDEDGGGNNDDDNNGDAAPCALGEDGAWRVTLQDWETGEDAVVVLDGVGGALVPQDQQQLAGGGKGKKKKKGGVGDSPTTMPSQVGRPQAPLSARDHAESLYKRARKLRRALDALAPLLSAAEAEASYLAELAASIEGLERYQGPDDLAALRGVEAEVLAAAAAAGGGSGGGGSGGSGSNKQGKDARSAAQAALAAKGAAKGRKAAKQLDKQQQQRRPAGGGGAAGAGGEDVGSAATVDGARPRRFVSPGGRVVLVGRHNRQNDALSLKAAAPNDVWMHVRGVPGSHVVLRASALPSAAAASAASSASSPSALAPDVSEACLQFAADLAVFFSKARHSGRADVVVCRAGELKKPRGARPGQVMVGRELGNAVGRPERVLAVAEGGAGGTN